uniref:hypothetical protein n=1 Tax=Candidatus Electrothrix sp. TaxID=2170559 RepID=UPI004056727B
MLFRSNQEFLDKKIEVMIESNTSTGTQGRTGSNHIVHFSTPTNLRPGDLAWVTITRAGQHSLKGELAPPEAS